MHRKIKIKIGLFLLASLLIFLCLAVSLVWYCNSSLKKHQQQIDLEIQRLTDLVKTNESVLKNLCIYELNTVKTNRNSDLNSIKCEGEFQQGRDCIFKEMGFTNVEVFVNDKYILFDKIYLDTVIFLKYSEKPNDNSPDDIYITDCFYITFYDRGHTFGG